MQPEPHRVPAAGAGDSRPPPEGAVLPEIARLAVVDAVTGGDAAPPAPPGAFLSEPHPVFVTLRDRRGKLRGCVGTLSARCPTVVEETWCMAREAALADRRFDPVTLDELPDLRFEVSVLSPLEPVRHVSELDPARFGVVVSTRDGRRGALLPHIEGVSTVAEQLSIARRKAGIHAAEDASIARFTVQHFQESA